MSEDAEVANNRKFTLCEATLQRHTRDVYGHSLPTGNWQYRVIHDQPSDLILDIRVFDSSRASWKSVGTRSGSKSTTEIQGQFSTYAPGEVKFIFSSPTAASDIRYRCDVIPG